MIWIKNVSFCVITLSMAGSIPYLGVQFYCKHIRADDYNLTSIWLKLISCLYLVPVIYFSLFISNLRYVNGVWIKIGELLTGLPKMFSGALDVIGILWLIGFIWHIIPVIGESVGLQRLLMGNVPVESKLAREIFKEYCTLPGLKHIRMYANDLTLIPFTVGVFRPIVIIPYGEYTEREYRIMIGHEMNHIRYGDMFWKKLCLITGWIHWFNPLAQQLTQHIGFGMEVLCDFRTMLHNPFYTRREYSSFLATMCDNEFSCRILSALAESENDVFRRIEIMAKQRTLTQTKKLVVFVSCVALTMLALLPTYMISVRAANMHSEMSKSIEELQHDLKASGYRVEQICMTEDGVTEILVEQDESMLGRKIYQLDFTIPAKTRVLYKYQRMTTGQLVTTASDCADSSVVYRIGIKNVNNWRALCIEGSGQMGHTFTVFEDDLFTVFVENMMDYPFDIIGCYIYP